MDGSGRLTLCQEKITCSVGDDTPYHQRFPEVKVKTKVNHNLLFNVFEDIFLMIGARESPFAAY